jgi:hypothetical protein
MPALGTGAAARPLLSSEMMMTCPAAIGSSADEASTASKHKAAAHKRAFSSLSSSPLSRRRRLYTGATRVMVIAFIHCIGMLLLRPIMAGCLASLVFFKVQD